MAFFPLYFLAKTSVPSLAKLLIVLKIMSLQGCMWGGGGEPGGPPMLLILPKWHLHPRAACHRLQRALQVAAAACASPLAPIKSLPQLPALFFFFFFFSPPSQGLD